MDTNSTTESLSRKMARHKRNCKSYLYTQCKPPKKSFDEFCVENCKIILIEEYQCQNKKQLEKREG